MEKLSLLKGTAVVVPLINIDTDMIIPKQFLKTIKRTGLGEALFFELRKENPDFPLNTPQGRQASILVAGANFGCGSSREHAPWALLDFGIRAIIAPSFADIFYNNCFKNGLLPLILNQKECALLEQTLSQTPEEEIEIDLPAQKLRYGAQEIGFEIEPFRKESLLGGLDDIGRTLQHLSAIEAYEARMAQTHPWL